MGLNLVQMLLGSLILTSVWGAPLARHLYDTWRKDFDGLKYTLSLVIKIYFCGGKIRGANMVINLDDSSIG